MNGDDIERMAVEAGGCTPEWDGVWELSKDALERFANLVAAAELRRVRAENEALTATRDRQASMLRRLEEREAELDAEIGRLRDELRQSSIDITRAEVERLREALEKIATVNAMDYEYVRWAKAALRREETT